MRTIDGIDYCENVKEVSDLLENKFLYRFSDPLENWSEQEIEEYKLSPISAQCLEYWHLINGKIKMSIISISFIPEVMEEKGRKSLLFCRPLFEDNDKFMIPIYHPDFDIKFGMLHDKRVKITTEENYD